MPAPPQSGNEILIPLFSAESAGKPVTLEWSQNTSTRKADYYALTGVDNITTGEQVLLFIAAEYYKNSTKANPNHITKVAELVEGEGYKLKIDSLLQYGQKNAEGELRFIVYHDKERKPFQHRFIQTAAASAAGGKVGDIAKGFGVGVGGVVDSAMGVAKSIIGDYLHDF